MATYSQGTRPTRLNTRSPGASPRPRNPWANAEVRADRSAYVTSDGGRVLGKAAQGDMVATAVRQVPVDRLVRDVQPPGRQAVEPPPGLIPGERRAHGVVVVEMGWHPQLGGGLVDHSCLQVTGIHASAVPAATGATLGALVPPVQRPPRGATDRSTRGAHRSVRDWTAGRSRRTWWARPGSNRRPTRCKRVALPAALRARGQGYAPRPQPPKRRAHHTPTNPPGRFRPSTPDGRFCTCLEGLGGCAGRSGAARGRRAGAGGAGGAGSGDLGQCCAVVVGVADVTGAADDRPPHDALTVDHE